MAKLSIRNLRPQDRRLRAIVYTAVFLLLACALLILIAVFSDYSFSRESFFEPLFVSFLGGSALFIFSIIITVIQLEDPTEEGASRRIEILLQGKRGAHIDYFKEQLRSIEQFAEKSERKIVLKRLSDDGTRFYVEVHTKSIMRNFIDDVSTSYNQPLGLTSTDDNAEITVAHLRVGGKEQPRGQFKRGASFSGSYPITVPQGGSVEVEFGVYRWVRVGEEFNYTPAKYIRELTVVLENETSQPVEISLNGDKVHCPDGARREIFSAVDLRPRVLAYTSNINLSPSS